MSKLYESSNQVIDLFYKPTGLDIDESFSIAKLANQLLLSKNTEDNSKGRELVTYALNFWDKLPIETYSIWTNTVEACGFYPYIAKEESKMKLDNLAGQIRKFSHRSNFLGKYFHEDQLEAISIFNSGKNLILSAPTSFGKSLLIEEIVASKKFSNIIIIQPTLALLDETRRNLREYKNEYHVIIKTTQKYSSLKNIFLFTAERVMEYPKFPEIDLLIIDEFYKLSASRNDERVNALNIAFYKILKAYNPRFYLMGPNIDKVSSLFVNKYNANFYKTDYSLVTTEVINLTDRYNELFLHPKKNKDAIKKLLFNTLLSLKEQTIIYCSSPERARDLCTEFTNFLKDSKHYQLSQTHLPLINWIEENISPFWSLCESLKHSVAVHDAALPRHLSSSIIHQFNKNRIKYLFCTSTIIEGVNTSAKNVVIFDKKRGHKLTLDYFDYSNIKGRAGRLMVHYIGRVYNFHKIPPKTQVEIDIPFVDQHKDTSSEIFIQLDKSDVSNKENENFKVLKELTVEEFKIFKKNGVSINGQKKILEQLMLDLQNPVSEKLIRWNFLPTYDQIVYAISLASNYLLEGKSSLGFSIRQFSLLLKKYINDQNLMLLVKNMYDYKKKNNEDNLGEPHLLDTAIRSVFQFQRHWLDYSLPKWFYVIDSLQKHACTQLGKRAGSYTYFATNLENDFVNNELTFLIEMGLPKSAVVKIEKNLKIASMDEDEIIGFIKRKQYELNFTEYELERLNDL